MELLQSGTTRREEKKEREKGERRGRDKSFSLCSLRLAEKKPHKKKLFSDFQGSFLEMFSTPLLGRL